MGVLEQDFGSFTDIVFKISVRLWSFKISLRLLFFFSFVGGAFGEVGERVHRVCPLEGVRGVGRSASETVTVLVICVVF